jgi:hypothetical protein
MAVAGHVLFVLCVQLQAVQQLKVTVQLYKVTALKGMQAVLPLPPVLLSPKLPLLLPGLLYVKMGFRMPRQFCSTEGTTSC